jgi:hypothetical protein
MQDTKQPAATGIALREPVVVREQEPVGVEGEAVGPCPNCGATMNAIRGSKSAVCQNCGFKDSCCF